MTITRWHRGGLPLSSLCASAGSRSPRRASGRSTDPAPIVRARSVGPGRKLPQGQVVPALIDRLEDSDPVVRLAAFEELKKGTGRTFGFVPWGGDTDRARPSPAGGPGGRRGKAVSKVRTHRQPRGWWTGSEAQGALAGSARTPLRTARARRGVPHRRTHTGQGGPPRCPRRQDDSPTPGLAPRLGRAAGRRRVAYLGGLALLARAAPVGRSATVQSAGALVARTRLDVRDGAPAGGARPRRARLVPVDAVLFRRDVRRGDRGGRRASACSGTSRR